MEQNAKIMNNSYNNVEFARERTVKSASISVDVDASSLYEEATTDDMDGTIMKRKLNELLLEEFEQSPWAEKYAGDKKVEKSDISDLYYYFRNTLMQKYNYNEVDVLCAIAEFFALNYTVLYHDILTMDSKMKIIKTLKETHGLKQYLGSRAHRLY